MKLFFILIFTLILVSCSGNTDVDENCNFLLDINVNTSINLNLPQYSQLQFAGNSIYIANVGNKGVIIANTGADFLAWDAADPNIPQSTCSVLVPNGLEATSNCDDQNTYSLANGTPLYNSSLRCALKFYAVQQNGDTLVIFN